jgi:hypothetical protein
MSTFQNSDYEKSNAKLPQEMRDALDDYCAYLKANYEESGYTSSQHYEWEAKRQYVVIWAMPNKSSHSWVVFKPDAKFNCGDILKSASWRGPAKNFARGNVLRKEWSRCYWAGVN